MYRRMLVLLDGSELSEIVFEYAQQLSGRLKLDLELLHVCSPREAEELPMRRVYMEHMAEQLRKQAEEISSRAGVRTAGRVIQARAEVVVGDPAEEILKYLDEHKIDLVMMSTRGRSGSRSFGIGNVTNQVLHGSRVPVWLVPSELSRQVVADTLPRRRLVIPLDGSPAAEAVLPHAITIATQRGAESELVLLHVHDPARFPAFLGESEREGILRKIEEYLADIANTVKDAGFAARTEVLTGDVAPTIIQYLKANPPQLIAMATWGHGTSADLVCGTVTQHVLQLIRHTPMLLVSAAGRSEA